MGLLLLKTNWVENITENLTGSVPLLFNCCTQAQMRGKYADDGESWGDLGFSRTEMCHCLLNESEGGREKTPSLGCGVG